MRDDRLANDTTAESMDEAAAGSMDEATVGSATDADAAGDGASPDVGTVPGEASTGETVRYFDPETVACVPTEVVLAIADVENVDFEAVGPLQEHVSCEALDRLFRSDVSNRTFSLSFEYEALVVTITDDGRVTISH